MSYRKKNVLPRNGHSLTNLKLISATMAFVFCSGTNAQQVTLPPVPVTADAEGDQSKKQLNAERTLTPGGVTVIESEDIALRNVTGLSDLLRYAPGVWAASASNGDGTFLSIRGSNLDSTNYDGNGVTMLVDGLPVTAADGNNHNRDIDPLAMQRAIILRGANALTYGSSTLGGAINFISPTARDGAPNEVSLRGGSHGEIQTRGTFGQVFGKADALVTFEDKRSEGFRPHSRQDRQGLYGNFGVQLNETVATRFYATSIKNDQELPGALTMSQFKANPRQAEANAISGDYRLNVNTQRFANRTAIDLGAGKKLVAGVSFEEQDLFHPIFWGAPGGGPFSFITFDGGSFMKDEKTKSEAGHLRYQQQESDHDFVVGLDLGTSSMTGGYYTYTTHANRTLSSSVNNNANNIAAFAVDRWSFAPQWKLVYGAQAIRTSRTIRSTVQLDETYSSVNPRVGLIHDLTPNSQLFANISRAYEAPTLFQTTEFANSGTGANTGRPVKATNGIVYEVGTRGQSTSGESRLYWDTALYYTKLNDEILSATVQGTTQSFNASNTVHAGVEALVGASIPMGSGHQIAPLVSATFNRFNFVNDGIYGNNKLPAAPTYAVRGELLYKHVNGIFAGPTFDMIGSRYADFASTYKVDAYSLWGLRAGYSEKSWEVYGELRNASDKSYISYTTVSGSYSASDAVIYPGAPRSFYAGAKFRF